MNPTKCHVVHDWLSLRGARASCSGRIDRANREESRHKLNETRLYPLTHEHVQVDVDLKADLARPNALLFKVCSKCNARVLQKVLDLHERFCYGAVERWGNHRQGSCCFGLQQALAGGEEIYSDSTWLRMSLPTPAAISPRPSPKTPFKFFLSHSWPWPHLYLFVLVSLDVVPPTAPVFLLSPSPPRLPLRVVSRTSLTRMRAMPTQRVRTGSVAAVTGATPGRTT